MKEIRIGISSIGSGVGQSIINSCNLSNLPLFTVGFGNNPFAYGLYECNDYAYVKSYYDDDYIEDVIQTCIEKKIDIYFPGHDDDAYIISQNINKFKEKDIKVIVAGESLIELSRNKQKLGDVLNKDSNLFVKSYTKNKFIQEFKKKEIKLPVIAKPKAGYASKGIEIILAESDFNLITDNHIVQELAVPHKNDPNRKQFDNQINNRINPQIAEISIQIVADQNGNIMGKMMSYNKLNNGVPIEIILYENETIWKEIFKIYPKIKELGIAGPLNLQGRLTDNGLKLFEINARFTGITGLRALMGFNEVEMCIKEWINIRTNTDSLIINHNRFGIRQVIDKVVDLNHNKKIKDIYTELNHGLIKKKKTILITGSTGYIGQNLINSLSKDLFEIWALGRNKKKLEMLFGNDECIKLIDIYMLKNGKVNIGNVDILLHLGFSRPFETDENIAKSLEFTYELFTIAAKNQVPAIINISSQSVYGQLNPPLWNENSPVAPNLVYSQAKYATELLLKSLNEIYHHLKGTSLRLAAVTGKLPGAVNQDLISKLVHKIKNNEKIIIEGGHQQFEFIDVRDVLTALSAFLLTNPLEWEDHYNLGSGKYHTLNNIINIIANKSETILNKRTNFKTIESNTNMQFGMDSSKLNNLINWETKYNLEDSIDSLMQ